MIIVRKFGFSCAVLVAVLQWPGAAHADPCAAVEREMTFGEVALKHAKDRTGYLKSAGEFEQAAAKAPGCASAHFNLGLVLEKAGQFKKARRALLKYLELTPNAADAAGVRKKTYELEYLAREGDGKGAASAAALAPSSPWSKLEGAWCQIGLCDGNSTPVFDVTVKDDAFRMVMRPLYSISGPQGDIKCKIGMQDIYEGTISAGGAIRGTRKGGDKRFEPHCVAGNLPYNQWNWSSSPTTGRVMAQGAILEFKFNQYVRGRPHPTTLQFQRR